MNRKWELYLPDDELVQKVAYENSISETLATILVNRNIYCPMAKEGFDEYLWKECCECRTITNQK